VIEEKQDSRQCGNLEPRFKQPVGHGSLLGLAWQTMPRLLEKYKKEREKV
jgi:hypothetical protein